MTFKEKRWCLALFLLHTVATATGKPSVDPTPLASQDRDQLFPSTRGPYRPATRGGRRRMRLDLPPGGRSRGLGDVSGDRKGQIRGSAVTFGTDEGVKNRENARRELASPGHPSDDCVAGKVESVTPGRVYISGQLDITALNVALQADSAFPGEKTTDFDTTTRSWLQQSNGDVIFRKVFCSRPKPGSLYSSRGFKV